MSQKALIIFLITLAPAVMGQFSGGVNDGFALNDVQQTSCAQISATTTSTGGLADGFASGALTQSACAIDQFDLLFSGGVRDGYTSGALTQSSCAIDQFDFLFAGGLNDGSSAGSIFQSTCPISEEYLVFNGGINDGAATAALLQVECPEAAEVHVFRGGEADGGAMAMNQQSNCAPVHPPEIWYGGILDGYAKGINEQTLCLGMTPLPIELLDWDAQCEDGSVALRWATATGTNNDHFTLERSLDGSNWELVAQVEAVENSQTVVRYEYVDKEPYRALVYYKLSQTDLDGTRTEFHTVAIDCQTGTTAMTVYPNPNNGQFTVAIYGDATVHELQIHSSTGKLVRSLPWQGGSSQVDLSELPSGVYYLRALSNKSLSQQKVVVER